MAHQTECNTPPSATSEIDGIANWLDQTAGLGIPTNAEIPYESGLQHASMFTGSHPSGSRSSPPGDSYYYAITHP